MFAVFLVEYFQKALSKYLLPEIWLVLLSSIFQFFVENFRNCVFRKRFLLFLLMLEVTNYEIDKI